MTGEEPEEQLCPVCGAVLSGVFDLPPELLGAEVEHEQKDPPKRASLSKRA